MKRVLERMIKIQKKNPKNLPLQEQSGLIISSTAFKHCPSEQSGLPEEAENRGKRRKPMTRGDKTAGKGEVKW